MFTSRTYSGGREDDPRGDDRSRLPWQAADRAIAKVTRPARSGASARLVPPRRMHLTRRRSSRSSVAGRRSGAFDGLEAARADGFAECLVVVLVLVGVALREVGDRLVEAVLLPEVRGDGHGVAGAGVGA